MVGLPRVPGPQAIIPQGEIMGDLVQFPMERVKGRGSSRDFDRGGEVVLFTGVRYERIEPEGGCADGRDVAPRNDHFTDAVADGDRGGAKLS